MLLARRTGQSGKRYNHFGYEGQGRIYQYKIVDRHNGRDAHVGTVWGINQADALKTYRMERQGKTD